MKNYIWVCVLSCSVSFVAQTALAATDGKTSVATGFDSTSGNYGASSNTTILTIPVIGKYEIDSWLFKLTVPYLQVTTVSGVIPGIGMGGIKKAGSTVATTQSGLGDVVAASTYYAIEGDDVSPGLDLTAKVKLPTADKNAGLGTGETDYAIQADVYQNMAKVTVSASLGRKFLGSSSALPLNDIFYGSVGASYRASDKVNVGVNLDAAQASSANGVNQLELTANISRKIDKTKKIQAYVLKGFTDASPDTGFGVLFTFAF
jgi:hypothetical protein